MHYSCYFGQFICIWRNQLLTPQLTKNTCSQKQLEPRTTAYIDWRTIPTSLISVRARIQNFVSCGLYQNFVFFLWVFVSQIVKKKVASAFLKQCLLFSSWYCSVFCHLLCFCSVHLCSVPNLLHFIWWVDNNCLFCLTSLCFC